MCGIAGYVTSEGTDETILKKMTDRIAHRGPDGEGFYEFRWMRFEYTTEFAAKSICRAGEYSPLWTRFYD